MASDRTAGASDKAAAEARSTWRRTAALLVAGLLVSACSGGAAPGDTPGAVPAPTTPRGQATPEAGTAAPTDAQELRPTPRATPDFSPSGPGPDATPGVAGVVADGLDAPWGLAMLPDGSALVSERDDATILRVSSAGDVTEVGDVPGVQPGGEGGLLGLAVSADFADDRRVYAYFTGADDNRVVRLRYGANGGLGPPEVVIDGIERASNHNGGRIAFGPDGYLYVATGDASDAGLAQDVDSLNGKILRITADGDPAPGNPYDRSPVWSLGHRNVQGIAWDSEGRMWASEFGQNRFDELNLVQAGGNYGWPDVEGVADDDSGEYVDPVVVWSPDEASPSGIAVSGSAVYVAALRGARLWRVPVPGGEVGKPEDFFVDEYGRLRSVSVAPDGSLWLVTNNTDGRGDPGPGDDRILRVVLR